MGEFPMKNKRKNSLASVVAGYSALVIALGMALYAVHQYISIPGQTVIGLILEHSWHVLVLGALNSQRIRSSGYVL